MGESTNLEHHHIPVLLQAVLDGMALKPGGCYLDATVGGAGHATAILKATTPDGRILGLDRDPEAVNRAANRLASFGQRAQLVHASYVDLARVTQKTGFVPLDGILIDLGFSSWQIDNALRGFSFRLNGPLDMRFDTTSDEPSAADLVNQLSESEIVDLLWQYGEEPRSRRIAQAIVAARPIHSTKQLATIIEQTIGRARGTHIHPATQTFQALRIAVNEELEGIHIVLPQALKVLRSGGRLAVITFHSLEDRIVKQFFKQQARGCICPPKSPICTCGQQPTVRILTRKPISPTEEEILANPRSRSAKLRIVEKI